MMLDSIDNGLLVYPTVEENRQTRPMKYSKLTEAQLQDDFDVQRTNIILHGLPPDVYALVKDIWDRVKLLMKGTKLSYQECECRLYNLFNKFAYVQGEIVELLVVDSPADQFLPSNNQLGTSSNPRNQATIQDGRVTIQQVQGRQSQSFAGIGNRGIATTLRGNYAAGQRMLHGFKEKLMLAEAQEAGQILDEEQLAFLADPRISEALRILLIAHPQHSSCDHEVLFEESQNAVIQDTNSSRPNDLLVLSLFEQMTDHVAHLDKENQTNKMVNESLTTDLCETF
ncbi:hypothetical protein Tco_1330204 [Tanacetum coccineum]